MIEQIFIPGQVVRQSEASSNIGFVLCVIGVSCLAGIAIYHYRKPYSKTEKENNLLYNLKTKNHEAE
jgi:hypothetical protein